MERICEKLINPNLYKNIYIFSKKFEFFLACLIFKYKNLWNFRIYHLIISILIVLIFLRARIQINLLNKKKIYS